MNRRSDGLYVIGEDVLEKLVESVAKDCANVARISGGVLFKSEPARAEADRIFYKINHRYGMPE